MNQNATMGEDDYVNFLRTTKHVGFAKMVVKLKLSNDYPRNRRNLNNASLATKIKFRKVVLEAVAQYKPIFN